MVSTVIERTISYWKCSPLRKYGHTSVVCNHVQLMKLVVSLLGSQTAKDDMISVNSFSGVRMFGCRQPATTTTVQVLQ